MNTITKPHIQIPMSNKKCSQKCLRFHLPHLINTNYLPECAIKKVTTHSFQGFIKYSKNIILNNYNMNCQIRNCFICAS